MNEFRSFDVSYERFREHFEQVNDPKDAAMIACVYTACARVGEIVRGNKTSKPNPPINRDSIEFTPRHMIITVFTEKTHQWRRVPSSREREDWLHEPIRNWLGYCDYELFPHTTRWAEMRFQKWFGTQHIHLLRHWACTHALQGKRTKERLQPQYVARLGGWTTFNSFYKTYSHFIVEDFIDQI